MTDKENNRPVNGKSVLADEIFCASMGIHNETERIAFIDESCDGDNELHRLVAELFSLQEKADTLFQMGNPTRITAAEIVDTLTNLPEFFANAKSPLPDDDEVGKQIGNYKLLLKIGEGGVGNVYLAEQVKPVRRQVALKIIKAGMDTRSVIARFEAERQALAMMEHPNIAHVLNAGETETGRPYFVMELVQGERITTYCDENRLTIQQRLELFIPICHAIQHAHQKGIIHRDIKPSNVLITQHDGEPSPLVIDFGIAKATGSDLLTDKTINTSIGPIIGTPTYMSPEQTNLTQVDIDTRTDIYSLGVLLYELLTSKPPFDQTELLKAGIDEMCRILREKEPCRPSIKLQKMVPEELQEIAGKRGMNHGRLCHMVAGDLDWIVMKALEKNRERRYETANALAMDIEHFLNDEPVLARPPSRRYRFHKLVRRNKRFFATATAISMALVIGLGTSCWFLIKEREARKRAVLAEQQQSRLRQAAEDRERIAYAAALINQNKIEEADQLVAEISTEPMPSLEVGSVLRKLGVWNARMERWETAVKLFTSLLKADVMDNSDAVSMDLLLAGPVLVETGNIRGYEEFRRAAIERHRGTEDWYAAERTLKICLLLPADGELMAQLEAFRDLAAANTPVPPPDDLAAWRCISLALMAYRQNSYSAAIAWCEHCRVFNADATSRTATSHIIQAMAHHRLDEAEAASEQLARGRRMVEDWFATAPEKRTDQTGYWFDWLFARILLIEAEAQIKAAPDSRQATVP